MRVEDAPPNVSPPRDAAMPESYAVYVVDERIHVWQYRADVTGETDWRFVETVNRDGDPRLTLEYAELTAPTPGGYWVYTKSYDCTMDCD